MDIIQTFYDKLASQYDKLFLDWNATVTEQAVILDGLFRKYGFDRTARILDCACGIGTQAIGLAGLGYPVTASDISAAELLEAEKRAAEHQAKITFARADFRTLEEVFPDTFDIVIAMDNALPHMLTENDLEAAAKVEPLEQVVDGLKEQLRQNHIARLQRGECTIEAGFIWTDLLTALNRTSDHCSNVAACVLDTAEGNLNLHEFLRDIKENDEYFKKEYRAYQQKYVVASVR